MQPKDDHRAQTAKAEKLARRAHCGQTDKPGVDYFAHVRAVADAVAHLGPEYEIVALLHDSLEDCDDPTIVSPQILTRQFGPKIAASVDAMTRRTDEDDAQGYLARVMSDPVALEVKRADLAHNRSRLHLLSAETRARLQDKYDGVAKLLGET